MSSYILKLRSLPTPWLENGTVENIKYRLRKADTPIQEGDELFIWIFEKHGGRGLEYIGVVEELSHETLSLRFIEACRKPFGKTHLQHNNAKQKIISDWINEFWERMAHYYPNHANLWQLPSDVTKFLYTFFEESSPAQKIQCQIEEEKQLLEDSGEFDPQNEEDARQKIMRAVAMREGQPEFRKNLLDYFGRKCVITGCNVEDVLEAAHIVPYKGKQTNHLHNGLLLRADIHTLFDKHLIAIDSDFKVRLDEKLLGGGTANPYKEFHGKELHLGDKWKPAIEERNEERNKKK